MDTQKAKQLIDFIDASPSAFHAVQNAASLLEKHGFKLLKRENDFALEKGGAYYTEYNGIYENGIVFGSFLEWKNIFSWKKIDDYKISILKQDGLRFDIETDDKQAEIIDYFISKGIDKEE